MREGGLIPCALLAGAGIIPAIWFGIGAPSANAHVYDKPGTYLVPPRGVSQRQGDAKTSSARIDNLPRLRVGVTGS